MLKVHFAFNTDIDYLINASAVRTKIVFPVLCEEWKLFFTNRTNFDICLFLSNKLSNTHFYLLVNRKRANQYIIDLTPISLHYISKK